MTPVTAGASVSSQRGARPGNSLVAYRVGGDAPEAPKIILVIKVTFYLGLYIMNARSVFFFCLIAYLRSARRQLLSNFQTFRVATQKAPAPARQCPGSALLLLLAGVSGAPGVSGAGSFGPFGAPLTVLVVVAPHLHELVGGQLPQLPAVRVAVLPHEVGGLLQVELLDRGLGGGSGHGCGQQRESKKRYKKAV